MEQGVLDEEVALEEDVQLKYASTGQSARWDTSCVCVVRTAILMALSV